MRFTFLALAVVWFIFAIRTRDVLAFDRKFDETTITGVSTVYEQTFSLSAGGTYTFWTSGLTQLSSGQADPVMHVYDTSTGGTVINASNDDCTLAVTSGRNPCIQLTNPSGQSRTVRVLIHAFATTSRSSGIVSWQGPGLNGSQSGEFGGHVLTSVYGPPFGSGVGPGIGWNSGDRIHVVRPLQHLPLGASYRSYAIGRPSSPGTCHWNDVRFIRRSASSVGGGQLISSLPSASATWCLVHLIVGATPGVSARSARVYVNDYPGSGSTNDADGDTLGNALELEVGTCLLLGFGPACAYTNNARDTDADGLADNDELLGTQGNWLATWGADPLHKDAFVEIDWNSGLGSNPMSATIATTIAAVFAGGPAASMQNPDSAAGLNVHFDIGIDPCSGSDCCVATGLNCQSAYGDWGHSTSTSQTTALGSATNDMISSRLGVFFHGLIRTQDGGTSKGWYFDLGAGSSGPAPTGGLAHELGHSLGDIRHWGDRDGVDSLVCKPNYPSIVSYSVPTTDAPPPAGYLTLSSGLLDPVESTSLNEANSGTLDTQFLSMHFGLTASGPANAVQVDWNRNGTVGGTVAAPTRWATTNDSCQVGRIHINELNSVVMNSNSVPALVEYNGTLYAFFVSQLGNLMQMTLSHPLVACAGGVTTNCCPTDSNNSCMTWSAPVLIASAVTSSASAATFTASNGTQHIALTYSTGSGSNRQIVIRSIVPSDPTPVKPPRTLAISPISNVNNFQPTFDPSIVYLGTSVSTGYRLRLYYLGTGGEVRRVRFASLDDTYTIAIDEAVLTSVGGSTILSGVAPVATPFIPASGPAFVYFTATDTSSNNIKMFSNGLGYVSTEVTGLFPSSEQASTKVSIARNPEMGGALEMWYGGTSAGSPRRTWAPVGTSFLEDKDVFDSYGTDRKGFGLTAYQGKLQSANTCFNCSPPNIFQHMPFASGIFEFVEEDNDDFEDIAEALCIRLRQGISIQDANTFCNPAAGSPLTLAPQLISCKL